MNEEIIQLVKKSGEEDIAIVEDKESGQNKQDLNKDTLSPIKIAQFSDSIVLFSNDVSKRNLNRIASVASKIMNVSLSKGFPIKGALAKGMLTNDTAKQLFFGRALIDAYLLEEELFYYGIAVHHSAEESVKDEGCNIFCDNELFLKSGRISHYEICWYGEVSRKETEENLQKIRQSVSGQPRKYIDNTLALVKKHFESQPTPPAK